MPFNGVNHIQVKIGVFFYYNSTQLTAQKLDEKITIQLKCDVMWQIRLQQSGFALCTLRKVV